MEDIVVASYLGEQGGPDGLDLLDLGSLDQGLELVGLKFPTLLVSFLVVIFWYYLM